VSEIEQAILRKRASDADDAEQISWSNFCSRVIATLAPLIPLPEPLREVVADFVSRGDVRWRTDAFVVDRSGQNYLAVPLPIPAAVARPRPTLKLGGNSAFRKQDFEREERNFLDDEVRGRWFAEVPQLRRSAGRSAKCFRVITDESEGTPCGWTCFTADFHASVHKAHGPSEVRCLPNGISTPTQLADALVSGYGLGRPTSRDFSWWRDPLPPTI